MADMRYVTDHQLNFFRESVDKRMDAIKGYALFFYPVNFFFWNSRVFSEKPFVITVVFHPPEWTQLGVGYHAVFIDDWDFTYIDSLGVDLSFNQDGEINDTQVNFFAQRF
jgi:hypothetical protein